MLREVAAREPYNRYLNFGDESVPQSYPAYVPPKRAPLEKIEPGFNSNGLFKCVGNCGNKEENKKPPAKLYELCEKTSDCEQQPKSPLRCGDCIDSKLCVQSFVERKQAEKQKEEEKKKAKEVQLEQQKRLLSGFVQENQENSLLKVAKLNSTPLTQQEKEQIWENPHVQASYLKAYKEDTQIVSLNAWGKRYTACLHEKPTVSIGGGTPRTYLKCVFVC